MERRRSSKLRLKKLELASGAFWAVLGTCGEKKNKEYFQNTTRARAYPIKRLFTIVCDMPQQAPGGVSGRFFKMAAGLALRVRLDWSRELMPRAAETTLPGLRLLETSRSPASAHLLSLAGRCFFQAAMKSSHRTDGEIY